MNTHKIATQLFLSSEAGLVAIVVVANFDIAFSIVFLVAMIVFTFALQGVCDAGFGEKSLFGGTKMKLRFIIVRILFFVSFVAILVTLFLKIDLFLFVITFLSIVAFAIGLEILIRRVEKS